MHPQRIVITGVGLTCPLGNDLPTFRQALLDGKSGVVKFPVRNMGEQAAGVVNLRKQNIKIVRKYGLVLVREELNLLCT